MYLHADVIVCESWRVLVAARFRRVQNVKPPTANSQKTRRRAERSDWPRPEPQEAAQGSLIGRRSLCVRAAGVWAAFWMVSCWKAKVSMGSTATKEPGWC